MFKKYSALIIASIIFLVSVTVASAQTRKPDFMRTFEPRVSSTPRVWFDPKPSRTPWVIGDPKPSLRPRVSGDPKPSGSARACEVKVRNLRTRSENLVKTTTTVAGKFDSILKSVDNYYTGTLVPSGKTLSNYRQLMNNVQTTDAKVDAALAVVKTDIDALSCNTGNLEEAVKKFNTDVRAAKKALNENKGSIVNVVKAVRSVGGKPGATLKPGTSPSPRVSVAPGATCKPVPSCIRDGCKLMLDPNENWCTYRPEGRRPSGCVPPPSCLLEGCKLKLDAGVNWCPSAQ
jgi:hypothetical protein